MNKRVKRACAWIAWAAVCLIIAVAGVGFSDRIRLETIMAFTEQDRIYYGIDSVNKEYRVFMKDLDTGKSDWLSQPWTNSGNKDTFYVMDLEAFGPEEVYVCYAVRPENKERSLRLEIIHYDLVHHREQERLIVVYRWRPHDVRAAAYVYRQPLGVVAGRKEHGLKDETDAAGGADVHIDVVHLLVAGDEEEVPGSYLAALDLRPGHAGDRVDGRNMLSGKTVGGPVLPDAGQVHRYPRDRGHRHGGADHLSATLSAGTVNL